MNLLFSYQNSNKTRGLSPITGLSETSCSSDEIPKPTNYNSSNVTFDLKNSTVSSNRFLVGSTVNYVCQKGYFIHKQEHLFHSTTTCLPNGNWSRVQDCIYYLLFCELYFITFINLIFSIFI
jgi:hypothetical protein